MATLAEIRSQVMRLTDAERAELAEELLGSLEKSGCGTSWAAEGVAEALRRDAEMDSDPAASISFEELKASVGR